MKTSCMRGKESLEMKIGKQIEEQDELLKLREAGKPNTEILLLAAIKLLYAHAGSAKDCGYPTDNWAIEIQLEADRILRI